MIDLINVTKTYETGTHALNGIDMHIDDGEFVFLVGQSGSGKSTIIKLLTAELKPTSGSILVNGYKLESIKRSSVPYMRRDLHGKGDLLQVLHRLRRKRNGNLRGWQYSRPRLG